MELKLLTQQGIPAATLHPAALLHFRFRNTYGLSKIHGMLMELPQGNSNTTSFKASGVEPEQMSEGLLTRTLLLARLQHHKSLKQVHYSTSGKISFILTKQI